MYVVLHAGTKRNMNTNTMFTLHTKVVRSMYSSIKESQTQTFFPLTADLDLLCTIVGTRLSRRGCRSSSSRQPVRSWDQSGQISPMTTCKMWSLWTCDISCAMLDVVWRSPHWSFRASELQSFIASEYQKIRLSGYSTPSRTPRAWKGGNSTPCSTGVRSNQGLRS